MDILEQKRDEGNATTKDKMYYRLIQIYEIKEELKKENVNTSKIIKLFRELFEDLNIETTALSCVEIDQLCTDLTVTGISEKLPRILQEFIDDCMTLHDYPSEYSLYSPSELLEMINDIYKNNVYDVSIMTLKENILKLFREGNDVGRISDVLNIHKMAIERQIVIARKLKQI